MRLRNPLKNIACSLITIASLSGAAGVSWALEATPGTPKLSVQLWSVKDDVAKDFEGTLTKLKAMGFDGVEFAGNVGRYADDPKGLKAFLDKLGLKASAAHVPFEKLGADNWQTTAEFYQALGCKYLIIPMDDRAASADGAKQIAAELSAIQAKLTPLGMHVGYHNHEVEMLGDMGKTPWDIIGQNTPEAVVLQQDVAWTEVAGKNPIDFIKAYPGRTLITHFKAAAPKPGNSEHPIIGQDSTDWRALIDASKTYGGTQWLVVEQEVIPTGMTPMQSVEASLKGLQQVLAKP